MFKDIKRKREYDREWYRTHPDYRKRQIKIKRKRKQEIRKFIQDYKAEKGCERCPENAYYCLDFHHIEGEDKEFDLGRSGGWSLKRIKEEIEKCIVLCANCHRKEHYRIEQQKKEP
jgi:hypothetical protein